MHEGHDSPSTNSPASPAHPAPPVPPDARDYAPVPFPAVKIGDTFWMPRQRLAREVTLPVTLHQLRETGRLDAFRLDWTPGRPHPPHVFWESDVAKWIESAAYCLQLPGASESVATHLDEVVRSVVSAQQPDGYLNLHFTVVEPEKRWTNLRDRHELYCAGHLLEAALAHHAATGKRTFLDAMIKYVAYIARVFGPGPDQRRGYPGHEEIELALVRLYRETRDPAHLDLARYFVDERGQIPYYFVAEAEARGEAIPTNFWAVVERLQHYQAHCPVREQEELVGHAVRALYLLAGVADVAAHGDTPDPELLATCERLWTDLVHRKMYVTGGVGSSGHNEGFTRAYDLPNDTAYAETCAAIANVFFNHRMLQFGCEGRFADVMERALYNGVSSAISLDGRRFFYVNPLQVRAGAPPHERKAWFSCSCCPNNYTRLLLSLGGYFFSRRRDGQALAVHLYATSSTNVELGDVPVTIRQETRYPWEGHVEVHVDPARPVETTLAFRVPGWCENHAVSVNDAPHDPPVRAGYATLARAWRAGDVVTLDFPMPVRRVYAHPRVAPDVGRVALQRGPLIYCLEEVDNGPYLDRVGIPRNAALETTERPDLLGGVVVIEGEGLRLSAEGWEEHLYAPDVPELESVAIRAIPYYAWANRTPGEMIVWTRECV